MTPSITTSGAKALDFQNALSARLKPSPFKALGLFLRTSVTGHYQAAKKGRANSFFGEGTALAVPLSVAKSVRL